MAESEGSGGGEKSFDPTLKRLQKAREDGNIPQSRELTILAVLVFFLITLSIFVKTSTHHFAIKLLSLMDGSFGRAFDINPIDLNHVWYMTQSSLILAILFALPLILSSLAAILAIDFLQTGFLFRPQAVLPDISRLSPMKGIKKIFGMNNLVETTKTIAKLVVFSFVLYKIFQNTLILARQAEEWSYTNLLHRLYSLFISSTILIVIVQFFIAILDNIWVRYHRFNKLKMSLQDIRDETKETEGDPHVKSRQRMIRRKRARQRMMQAVREATAIIMNPTHYAVAISYDAATDHAPKIIAKGMNDLALRIRDTATDSKIPVIRNPPLARNLYTVPLEAEIPPEYFQAVAAIIAYVIKLKTPAGQQNQNPPS